MESEQVATRIDPRVKKAVEAVCKAKGMKMNRFIEDALLDKLEELEDSGEVGRLRREPSRTLTDILKDLKARGRL